MNDSIRVNEIKWDRVFLKLIISSGEKDICFHLVKLREDDETRMDIIDSVSIKPDSYEDNEFHFNLNICQMNGRSFLENGRWHLAADRKGTVEPVNVSTAVAECFDELSRVFNYAEGKSYVITFELSDEENSAEELHLVINSSFMRTDREWKKKKSGTKGKMLDIASAAYRDYSSHGHKGNNLLFLSQTRDNIWGNLKALDERLKERGFDRKYNISYYFHNDTDGLSFKRLIGLMRLIAHQDYIFVDDFVPVFSYIDLPKGAKLVQTWHAGIGFKAVGYCRFGKAGSPHPLQSYHRKYTYAVASTDAAVDVYREVFAIEKDAFIKAGMPRLDGFNDRKRIEGFRRNFFVQYPQLKNRKIILFAPTYRGSGQKNAYYDYDQLDQNKIKALCGDKYAFLVKMHPFVKDQINIQPDCVDVIYDFSGYADINELYYVADILVTDYSSDYFEYALLDKPVLFFTYDREVYQLVRGVHRDVKKTAPGKVCDSFDELLQAIENEDFEFEKTKAFRKEYFSEAIGNSSDIIIDKVLQ